MSKEITPKDQAHICMAVIDQLSTKLQEFYELYSSLSTTFRDEIAATGIAVLATIDSLPIKEPAGVLAVGTAPGILKALYDLFDTVAEKVKISREELADMLVHGLKEDLNDTVN